jgi:hypothetical protein
MSADLYPFQMYSTMNTMSVLFLVMTFLVNLLKSLDPLTINEFEMFTKFDCIEDRTI